MISTTVPLRASNSSRDAKRLMNRYFRQIVRRSDAEHDELCKVVAVSFRPGDRTSSFVGKLLRPLGMPVLVVLTYGYHRKTKRRLISVYGFRADVATDGSVAYCWKHPLLRKNAALRPKSGGRGPVLDAEYNPSLLELVLRMDGACQRQSRHASRLPRVPTLPRFLLGFPPAQPPAFEVTSALRALAAKQLGVPLDGLGSNGTVLLQRLLRDIWEQSIIPADAYGNVTGHLLVDAALCTRTWQSLRVHEDFTDLVGTATWNPARVATALQVMNPAADVLARIGIRSDRNVLDAMAQSTVDAVETAMREAIGPAEETFAKDEIYDAIVAPEMPVSAWTFALPQLRCQLTEYVSACTTDQDLLKATRCPSEPLIASGAARIQVLRADRNWLIKFL